MSSKKDKLQERRDAVLLLRFRTTEPSHLSYKFTSYQRISQMVGLTYNQVQHMCVRAVAGTTLAKGRRKLTQLQEDFLLSP